MRHYIADANVSAGEIDVIDGTMATGGYPLSARYDLAMLYGPGQVAIALIADATGSDEKAKRYFREFQHRVLSRFEGRAFELSQEDVIQAVAEIERQDKTVAGRSSR